MSLFIVEGKTDKVYINLDGFSPEELTTAIQAEKPNAAIFYLGTIRQDIHVHMGDVTLWVQWEVPATDELASKLPEKYQKEYTKWKAKQTSKSTDEEVY